MTDLVAWQLKKYKPINRPCYLSYTWYYSTKHDFDNLRHACKYINDGIVKAGLLPDDGQKWILGFDGDYFIKVPRGEERVDITVTTKDIDNSDSA